MTTIVTVIVEEEKKPTKIACADNKNAHDCASPPDRPPDPRLHMLPAKAETPRKSMTVIERRKREGIILKASYKHTSNQSSHITYVRNPKNYT